jgi:uncharacterized protein YbaP (TraB family)
MLRFDIGNGLARVPAQDSAEAPRPPPASFAGWLTRTCGSAVALRPPICDSGARIHACGVTDVRRPIRTAATLALLALAVTRPAVTFADGQDVLWAVKGRQNTVYLLGSIHVLRAQDAALPPAAEQAFDDAERVVMEIDLDDAAADPLAMATEMQKAAALPDGQTLRESMGADYPRVADELKASGLDPEVLDGYAPWFVALTLLDLQLAARGYSPQFGIEQTLAARAIAMHKPIEGLETAAQQFQMLAGMPLPMQKRFLVMTLEETDSLDRELDELLRAWHSGDTVALARLLSSEYDEFPDLYRRLTVDRNRAWLPRIEQMLGDRDDYIVVVGALHLVGPESVVDLLRADGYSVVRE